MRKLIFLFFIPIFFGGKPLNTHDAFPCPCLDTVDTISPDTIRRIMAPIIAETVDSFREAKQGQLDSLNYLKDSLAIELRQLKREKKKYLIVGHTDTIPGEIWKWTYWKYPDGSRKFYKVFKYKIK